MEKQKNGWKSAVAIHSGFWLYLLAGGIIYFQIENSSYLQPSPPKAITINSTFCQELWNLVENYSSNNTKELPDLFNFSLLLVAVTDSCNNLTAAYNLASNGGGDIVWEYSSALFLCMTMLTTIGYGDFSPKTDGGKIFCILYGFIGIPICGLFLASTTNYFSNIFLRLYEKQKKKYKDKRDSILIAAIVFLIPGLCFFLFIPSAIFMVLEDWDYLDGAYFSFLSLTTIGFGDIVAARKPSKQLWFYRVCLVIWVTLGIAYWGIIIAFVMKALKSKELSSRWEKTSQAIAEQAREMRRVLERSHSILRSEDSYRYLSLKTKAAVEFALKLKGSTKKNHVKTRPSVQTVFQSQGTEDSEAKKELPGTQELKLDQHDKSLENLPTTFEEQTDIPSQNIIYRHPSLSDLINTLHPMSQDPIFDDHSMSMNTDFDFDASDLVDIASRESGIGIAMRESSRNSLPPELPSAFELQENVSVASVETRPEFHREWQVVKEVHGFWHHLESISRIVTSILRQIPNPRTLYQNYKAYPSPPTSPARPAPPAPACPLSNRTSPQLADLLMEAIMILQEAELTEINLDVVKE